MNQEAVTEFEDEFFFVLVGKTILTYVRKRESVRDGTLSGPRDEGVTRVKEKVKL